MTDKKAISSHYFSLSTTGEKPPNFPAQRRGLYINVLIVLIILETIAIFKEIS